ncbi:hypothetical protein SAMN02745157_2786 [Kaistia soli DSM 19436]|uniref:Uncharacterized protein n=1 Tax=Kaistia soli DSM 19436 TaxID=1122133 RepID=A0A1M5DSN4_9HYPH|nr:hypothetical protein [Kaistia soli]SHF69993.1 hypothetical protein SAMN02745157_2786 [Kaistia soli DSM 19436]
MASDRRTGRFGHGFALGLALLALAPAASAGELFKQPSIGLDPPKIIKSVPPSVMPSLNANQCQLAAGTCPLGRLQRSGTRCYCVSNGTARQGATRTKPQDIRPPLGE